MTDYVEVMVSGESVHPGFVGRTCSDCAHWKKPADRDDFRHPVRPDDYHGASYTTPGTVWKAPSDAERRAMRKAAHEADMTLGICGGIPFCPTTSELPTPRAAIIDGSEYYADLFTAADFGCVLFSARPVIVDT